MARTTKPSMILVLLWVSKTVSRTLPHLRRHLAWIIGGSRKRRIRLRFRIIWIEFMLELPPLLFRQYTRRRWRRKRLIIEREPNKSNRTTNLAWTIATKNNKSINTRCRLRKMTQMSQIKDQCHQYRLQMWIWSSKMRL